MMCEVNLDCLRVLKQSRNLYFMGQGASSSSGKRHKVEISSEMGLFNYHTRGSEILCVMSPFRHVLRAYNIVDD